MKNPVNFYTKYSVLVTLLAVLELETLAEESMTNFNLYIFPKGKELDRELYDVLACEKSKTIEIDICAFVLGVIQKITLKQGE